MTEQLRLTGKEKVLEIGTGSGYQTAILAELAAKVFSIEIRPELAAAAAARLKELGIRNVEVRAADGYRGWPEEAPFDGILVTAAPERVPPPLLEQLASTGRMVIPVGAFYQELKVIERQGGGYTEKSVLPVRFVPFVGEADRSAAPRPLPGPAAESRRPVGSSLAAALAVRPLSRPRRRRAEQAPPAPAAGLLAARGGGARARGRVRRRPRRAPTLGRDATGSSSAARPPPSSATGVLLDYAAPRRLAAQPHAVARRRRDDDPEVRRGVLVGRPRRLRGRRDRRRRTARR